MLRKSMNAACSAAVLFALTMTARADYVGTQAGGGPNITYGAYELTINGVKYQFTKSVPVDPATGLALPLALSSKQPAFGIAGTPSPDVLSVQGGANGVPLNVALTGLPPVIHTPTTAAGSVTAYSAGTTAAQALAAGSRRFLAIDNESTSATIACTFGTTLTAGINTAGSFTIPPGNTRTWGNTFMPGDAVWCVASAAATPVTIQAN